MGANLYANSFQIDVIDSSESDEDDENRRQLTFDQSLACTHSYLGEDMTELHGRTFHDNMEVRYLSTINRNAISNLII